MKKFKNLTYIIAGGLLSFSAVSCGDLDLYPYNQIEQSQSFQTIRDARTHNNGLYAFVRGRSAGIYTYSTDIQADLVNAGLDFGNRNGNPHRWDGFLSDDYTIRDVWSGYYGALANVNNQLAGFETMELSDADERAELEMFKGDAYFVRAYYHYNLVELFAKAYNAGSASTDPGVPVVLTYDVTAEPSRSSVADTYIQILQDLGQAKSLLGSVTGEQGATRFTHDAVLALEARVKLSMGDYPGAKAAADALIGTNRYPLITDADELKDFWHLDGTQEVIFQPFVVAPAELGPVNGNVYLGYNANTGYYIPDFIPTQTIIDLYDDNDHRKDVYFANFDVFIQGSEYTDLLLMNKYPGNPALFTGATTNYQHAPKLFRIAEAYLISAEAGYHVDQGQALNRLNELRVARGLSAVNFSGPALLDEIKNERLRELAFEGFRLSDMKRWGIGFNGRTPQDLDPVINGPLYHTLSKSAGDDKFVWGIPLRDDTVNPNITQNPGW